MSALDLVRRPLIPVNPWEDYVRCFRRVFNQPAMAVIGGEWKSGKTDYALHVAVDVLERNDLVSEVASNVKCEDERVLYVASSQKLKYWLHSNNRKKCYIFDEAIKHAYKRTPMARTQVSFIQVITELSKGRGRGLIVSQDPFMVDKDLLNPVFCRMLFIKGGFFKRDQVEIYSHLIEGGYRKFRGIPRTTVRFDPMVEADFSEYEEAPLLENEDLKIYYQYFYEKINYNKLSKIYELHPEEVKRRISRVAKVLFHISIPKADEVIKAIGNVKDEP